MNQANSEVQKFFDALSDEYTATIERCFPRYREMLWSLLEYLPKRRFESILELGAGTGNLTVLLSEAFPQSRITAVDLSGESLSVCGSRVDEDTDLRCDQRDFRQLEYPPGSFDLVVSSIAIHHLTSSEKQLIFDRIETWLGPQGVFSYADQFRGATDDIYACHMANWNLNRLRRDHPKRSLRCGCNINENMIITIHSRTNSTGS